MLPGVQRPRTLKEQAIRVGYPVVNQCKNCWKTTDNTNGNIAEQAIRVSYPLLNQCKNCWKTTDNTSGNIAEQAIRVGYPVVNQCKSCWNTPYSIILLEILLCAIYKKFVCDEMIDHFPPIWLNFTSHRALPYGVISHMQRNPLKLFQQCCQGFKDQGHSRNKPLEWVILC